MQGRIIYAVPPSLRHIFLQLEKVNGFFDRSPLLISRRKLQEVIHPSMCISLHQTADSL